jgi:osmotically-inducible protein OsmY
MKRVLNSLLCALGVALAMGVMGCGSTAENKSAGQVVDDTTILAKTKAALLNDPVVSGRSIHVDVNRGEVTLTGGVNSDVEKKKAEDITVGIDGVRTVINKLVVRQ